MTVKLWRWTYRRLVAIRGILNRMIAAARIRAFPKRALTREQFEAFKQAATQTEPRCGCYEHCEDDDAGVERRVGCLKA